MASWPVPDIDDLNRPYWDAIEAGHLMFQRCVRGHAWLPPRAQCPGCLASDWQWTQASGLATLKSWVVYHVAYHEAFRDRLPYNVSIVELDEGPRLITNVVAPADALRAELRLRLSVEREDGVALARFAPVE
jgi:uncharacterized OB-fold protein